MWIEDLRSRWLCALSQRGRCPRCGGARVWHNGIRLRKASLWDGETTRFVSDVPCRRLRCGDCSARWTHPPERVTRREHYQPCVVADAVSGVVAEPGAVVSEIARTHGCHRRTLARWVARVATVTEPAELARALVAESDAPVVPHPPELMRPTRSERLKSLGARAVWVLALLEALASLRGLEPPALAHAATFVPAVAPPRPAAKRAALGGERDPCKS